VTGHHGRNIDRLCARGCTHTTTRIDWRLNAELRQGPPKYNLCCTAIISPFHLNPTLTTIRATVFLVCVQPTLRRVVRQADAHRTRGVADEGYSRFTVRRANMSMLTILTVVRLVHLVGLIMGLGGAMLADFTIFTRAVIRPVSNYTISQTVFLSYVVAIGLGILWVSGFLLIFLNTMENPEFITNQKVWAKIAMVIVLTINGVLVHKMVQTAL
jgi:hypothetical protein